jgi:RNA polymerase sigma-70 factor (ECF subfamily)
VDLRKKSRTFLVDGEVVTDFEVVFRKFYRQLYLYAYNFVMDEMEAEDIVQDFFIYFWEKKYYLKINQNLRYYLYLSVRNAAINALQKNNMLSMEELSGIDMGIPEESIDEEEQEERNKLLLEKLQKLPRQELQVVRAVIMENKKYKEAAEELHISVNTLKTHLTRALRQLRKEYNLHSLFY